MEYLIDTHTLLWFLEDSNELSGTAKKVVEDERNRIFISIASLWEISIKTALGRLSIDGSYESILNDLIENSIEILPINFAHTVQQNSLPFHHRDPFDRIIVSQAIVEKMDFVSIDSECDAYFDSRSPKRIW